MTRFRLKFPQQEIALLAGEVLIGRSPACTVTIEDPLVSRRHARLLVSQSGTVFEDLMSRNGSRINGELACSPTLLRHDDIVSLGKHEFRFIVTKELPSSPRPTGLLRNCSGCRLPYPEEAGACPHCESDDFIEEAPVTEPFPEPAWALDMLNEMLMRTIALGRLDRVQLVVQRAIAHVDEHFASGGQIERKAFDAFVEAARSALSSEDARKLMAWASSVSERLGWSSFVGQPTTLR